MKRVEQQIERVRIETENEDFGDTFGISNEEFIGYLNDAQDRIYAEVVKTHPKFFMGEIEEDVPVNVEAYDLPTNLFLGQISLVEYASTQNVRDYYPLKQALLMERLSYPIGHPKYYIRRNKELLFVPVPGTSRGRVRISYVESLPTLDIRRAVVASATITNQVLSALTLDTTEPLDRDNLIKDNYLWIVNRDGELTATQIAFTDIDSTTGVVTLDGNQTLATGETITAGDYVTSGQRAANKSSLLDTCERYLISHMRMEILDRDANQSGTATQSSKMERLLAEVVASFADNNDDIMYPPVADQSYYLDDKAFY